MLTITIMSTGTLITITATIITILKTTAITTTNMVTRMADRC